MTKYTILLYSVLIIIVFLALVIRTIGIPTHNILFLFDNGRDLLYVEKIVLQHKLLLIGPSSGGLQGYFHGVFWYYLLAIPFIIGKGNPVAITLFVALLSTASIILAFWVLQKMTNISAALLGAVIYAFAAFSLATAKFPWNPYPIVWLMPFYFFGLYGFIQEKKYALPLIAFLTSLFIHFEAIYGLTLLPTFVIVIIMHFIRKSSIQRPSHNKFTQFFLALFLFLIPLLPTLFFDLRHHFLITSSLMKTFQSGGQNITHSALEHPLSMNLRFQLRTRDFYVYTFNAITNNFYINLLLLLGFFAGLVYLIKTVQKSKVFFICLIIVTLLSPLLFFLNLKYAVWSYYWIGNAPLYSLTFAFVVGDLWQTLSQEDSQAEIMNHELRSKKNNNSRIITHKSFLSSHIQRMRNYLFIVVIMVLIVIYNPFQYFRLWEKGDLNPGTQIFSRQMQVINTIYHDANNQPFSVYVSTPPLYDYVYRYLFSWTARTKHLVQPQDRKQRIVYVILEPVPSDPTGIFFVKTVVRTNNNPVKTFLLPGGIVVKKFFTSPNEKPADPNYFPQL